MSGNPQEAKLTADALRNFLESAIPFNAFLGLRLESLNPETMTVTTRLDMRPEFVGNPVRQIPHGGLISTLIDATAGAAAATALSDARLAERLATVDMRVDYLEPARGQTLYTRARVARAGKRIIAVRSEVTDSENVLSALGHNVFHVSHR